MNAIPLLLRRPSTNALRRTLRPRWPRLSSPDPLSSIVDDEEFEILESGAICDELPEDDR